MLKLGLSRIRELIKVASESGAAEVEIEERGVRIIVRQQGAQVMLQGPVMAPVSPQPGYAPGVIAPLAARASETTLPHTNNEEKVPEKAPAEEPEGRTIRAPLVGTFFRKPAPDEEPFVSVGSKVEVGDTVCIIEAMKNMNEVESKVAGTVTEILVNDAEPVSYDQELILVS